MRTSLIAALAALLPAAASAQTLSFALIPASTEVLPGDTLDVDVVFTGPEDFVGTGFEVNILENPDIEPVADGLTVVFDTAFGTGPSVAPDIEAGVAGGALTPPFTLPVDQVIATITFEVTGSPGTTITLEGDPRSLRFSTRTSLRSRGAPSPARPSRSCPRPARWPWRGSAPSPACRS